jgi:hypothetical protein
MSKKNAYPKSPVVVFWNDTVSHMDDDGSGNPRHKPACQITIGWLLKHDYKGVSLAFELGEDATDWREEQFVPSEVITKIEILEVE